MAADDATMLHRRPGLDQVLLHLLDTPLALLGEPFVISDVESIGDVEICLDSGREATTEDWVQPQKTREQWGWKE